MPNPEDTSQYKVVLNDEEQYSISFADQPLPDGWHEEGTVGTKAECLEHMDRFWTDMRPLSVRQRLDEASTA